MIPCLPLVTGPPRINSPQKLVQEWLCYSLTHSPTNANKLEEDGVDDDLEGFMKSTFPKDAVFELTSSNLLPWNMEFNYHRSNEIWSTNGIYTLYYPDGMAASQVTSTNSLTTTVIFGNVSLCPTEQATILVCQPCKRRRGCSCGWS